ncbi:AMP-binding protein, partial [Pacificitalea manganoxidans]
MRYRDLDRASTALAQALVAHGVRGGDVVAVALPRGFDLLVALVAVQRAGAAYVPLDPEDDSARRADM